MSDHSIEVRWLLLLRGVEYWLSFRSIKREPRNSGIIITLVSASHFHLNHGPLRCLLAHKFHSVSLKCWRNHHRRRFRSSTHRHHRDSWRCLNPFLHYIPVLYSFPSKWTCVCQFDRPWSYVISAHFHIQTSLLLSSKNCWFGLSLELEMIRSLNVLPP